MGQELGADQGTVAAETGQPGKNKALGGARRRRRARGGPTVWRKRGAKGQDRGGWAAGRYTGHLAGANAQGRRMDTCATDAGGRAGCT
jgi:hypothetical protein